MNKTKEELVQDWADSVEETYKIAMKRNDSLKKVLSDYPLDEVLVMINLALDRADIPDDFRESQKKMWATVVAIEKKEITPEEALEKIIEEGDF